MTSDQKIRLLCTVTGIFAIILTGCNKVTGVTLDETKLSLEVKQTKKLNATIHKKKEKNVKVNWKSSNTSVASVKSDGTVDALALGTAKITVTTASGGKTAECIVTVTPVGMVWISAGTFMQGSPVTEPGRDPNEIQRKVTLTRGFYMGKFPVTQEKYRAVTGTNPSRWTVSSDGDNPANRPVDRVTWYDAIEFCNKLSDMEEFTPVYTIANRSPTRGYPITNATVTADWGANGYRLPTEAEWEYACRAGTITAYNWGTDVINNSQANYNSSNVDANNTAAGPTLRRTTEVGSYAPNAWGLYDMHGNVLNWCWDFYGNYSSDEQTDPTGVASSRVRVYRGGAWDANGQFGRSAYRWADPPSRVDSGISFRVVRH
jgi:formylglycine-generating enzyme required for sulfatase activity